MSYIKGVALCAAVVSAGLSNAASAAFWLGDVCVDGVPQAAITQTVEVDGQGGMESVSVVSVNYQGGAGAGGPRIFIYQGRPIAPPIGLKLGSDGLMQLEVPKQVPDLLGMIEKKSPGVIGLNPGAFNERPALDQLKKVMEERSRKNEWKQIEACDASPLLSAPLLAGVADRLTFSVTRHRLKFDGAVHYTMGKDAFSASISSAAKRSVRPKEERDAQAAVLDLVSPVSKKPLVVMSKKTYEENLIDIAKLGKDLDIEVAKYKAAPSEPYPLPKFKLAAGGELSVVTGWSVSISNSEAVSKEPSSGKWDLAWRGTVLSEFAPSGDRLIGPFAQSSDAIKVRYVADRSDLIEWEGAFLASSLSGNLSNLSAGPVDVLAGRFQTGPATLTLTPGAFDLRMQNVTLNGAALHAVDLGAGATDVDGSVDALRLTGLITAEHEYGRPTGSSAVNTLTADWSGIKLKTPMLMLSEGPRRDRRQIANGLIGRAEITAKTFSSSGIIQGEIKLDVTSSGTLGDILGPTTPLALTLKADGPLPGASVTASVLTPGLNLGTLEVKESIATNLTFVLGNALRIPIDLDMTTPAGSLQVYGSSATKLTGQLKRFRLKGFIVREGDSTRLDIAPGGLDLDLRSSVATGPWLAGGAPQFADARLQLTAPVGLRIEGGAVFGTLEATAAGAVVGDPEIRLSAEGGKLAIAMPLKSSGSVSVGIDLPSGAVAPKTARFSLDAISLGTVGKNDVPIADLLVTNGEVKVDRLVIAYEEGKGQVELRGLSVKADSIGRPKNPDGSGISWSTSLTSPFRIESLKGFGALVPKKGFVVEEAEIMGFSLTTAGARFQDASGFSYQGADFSLSIPKATKKDYSATLRFGPSVLQSGQATVQIRSLDINVKSRDGAVSGSGSLEVGGGLASQNFDFPLRPSCDINGSDPVMHFRGDVRFSAATVNLHIDEQGLMTGRGGISNLIAGIQNTKTFNCSWTENVHVEFDIGYRIETPFGDWKDSKHINLGSVQIAANAVMDRISASYGVGGAYLVKRDDSVQICIENPYLREAPVIGFSVGVGPRTHVDYLDQVLAEATSRIQQPVYTTVASGLVASAGLLVQFAGAVDMVVGGGCQ